MTGLEATEKKRNTYSPFQF